MTFERVVGCLCSSSLSVKRYDCLFTISQTYEPEGVRTHFLEHMHEHTHTCKQSAKNSECPQYGLGACVYGLWRSTRNGKPDHQVRFQQKRGSSATASPDRGRRLQNLYFCVRTVPRLLSLYGPNQKQSKYKVHCSAS